VTSTTHTYDNEGNRIKRTETATGEVTNYTWDRRNRLTKVETKNGATVTKLVTYIYDVFDRRIGKSIDPDGSGILPAIIERFIYDRDHILLSFDGSSNLTHRYLHGAMLDQILADESNGQVLWTLTDNLGTVRDLVNGAGAVQNRIKYDSFGNITSQTNASINTRFGYTGRELDAETGLYYYRARYYDAAVGRFISEDPISFGGGDVNLSRYVGNNPVDKTDPYGLEEGVSIPDIIGNILVGIGAGVLWLLDLLGNKIKLGVRQECRQLLLSYAASK
jgi:RHS repeat-associated protein